MTFALLINALDNLINRFILTIAMFTTIARLTLAHGFLACILDTLAMVTPESLARAHHFDIALFATIEILDILTMIHKVKCMDIHTSSTCSLNQ